MEPIESVGGLARELGKLTLLASEANVIRATHCCVSVSAVRERAIPGSRWDTDATHHVCVSSACPDQFDAVAFGIFSLDGRLLSAHRSDRHGHFRTKLQIGQAFRVEAALGLMTEREIEILRSLALQDDHESRQALIEYLKDHEVDEGGRRHAACAEALGRIGDATSRDALTRRLNDLSEDDEIIRRACAEALVLHDSDDTAPVPESERPETTRLDRSGFFPTWDTVMPPGLWGAPAHSDAPPRLAAAPEQSGLPPLQADGAQIQPFFVGKTLFLEFTLDINRHELRSDDLIRFSVGPFVCFFAVTAEGTRASGSIQCPAALRDALNKGTRPEYRLHMPTAADLPELELSVKFQARPPHKDQIRDTIERLRKL